jgi:dihydrofolate reductase
MTPKRTQIGMIMARASNGVIGKNGVMPWYLPEDLNHFKQVTQGYSVIMGRNTWESIPERFRPLPKRRNIVLTRNKNWNTLGIEIAHDLLEAIQMCSSEEIVWVIGGAVVYALAEPMACIAEITEIYAPFEGDALAPTLGPSWREVARSPIFTGANGLRYSFVRYEQGHLNL